MEARHARSAKARLAIFQARGGVCRLCGLKIDAGQVWELHHWRPRALLGPDTDENLFPVHKRCHAHQTRTQDVPMIAKAKRMEAAHLGAKVSRWPMAGSRASGWKRKMDGTTVRR